MKNELMQKINKKEAVIGIIGLGYVGLPLAQAFLGSGFRVLGFDIDPVKVNHINQAESYIGHIGHEFLKEYVKREKTFSATADFKRLQEPDGLIICVPTPLGEHLEPDLSFVLKTTETIAENMRRGQVVVLESTSYPGTTEQEMLPVLEKSGLRVGHDFYLGYSPEREDPGNRQFSTQTIPKVVSGVSPDCLEVVSALYRPIVRTVPVSSPRVAEASKILENTYRAVNIALVNELKILFERMGIDIWEVIAAAKTKPFGFQPFYPGPGLGGHCIPIDPFYLTWKAREYGFHTRFIELAGEINSRMPEYVVEKTIQAVNSTGRSIADARILVVGVSYKENIDDMRESPALRIIDLLLKQGADLNYHDSHVPELPPTRKYQWQMKSVSLPDIKEGAFDAIVIVTSHSDIDYPLLIKKGKVIVDTRNALNSRGITSEKIWKA